MMPGSEDKGNSPVVNGSFGGVRHAGPGLEEASRAKASWGPSGHGADAGQPKSNPRSATDSQFTERHDKYTSLPWLRLVAIEGASHC